ncbi:hypothetical protein GGR51DRAFT_525827 [Nemania sp. FL0031]|nr:hypothetical protein GGR51DRAFT_525827 [Nemania sp. FL0031]
MQSLTPLYLELSYSQYLLTMSLGFVSLSLAGQEAPLDNPALVPPDGVERDILTYFLSTLFIIIPAYGKLYLMNPISLRGYWIT